MANPPVTWSYGDVATSAKLAQMVDDLRTHDHRTVDQGANLGARALASGIANGVAPNVAANGTGSTAVNLPVGRFANAPRIMVSILSAHVQGRRAYVLTDPSTSSFTIGVAAGVTGTGAGGVQVLWIAVDAP